MLAGLTIRDMMLIDRLELQFQPGLNVLTGETGAGKSILLDSLGFVLGWRGRGDMVRDGAARGEVEAEFLLPPTHPVRDLLAELDLPAEDSLVLRRSSTAAGRKQAYVNDRRCAGETLRAISALLVEMHGQHDDRGLLNPRGHRPLLDGFAAAAPLLAEVRAAWHNMARAERALADHRAHLARIAADRAYLEHALQELDALAPEVGEDAALDTARRGMQAAGRIRDGIARAAEALGGERLEGGLLDAVRWLDDAAPEADGRLDAPLAALARATEEVALAQQGVADCLQALDVDPLEIERIEERLFAIRALARKHSIQPDDLAAFGDDLRARLEQINAGEGEITALEKTLEDARNTYENKAQALSGLRRSAAHSLDIAMRAELAPLKMERAVFVTELSDASAGPDGTDAVRFTVSTNPGTPTGALEKIASGGELSRFLLALKVCLRSGNAGVTMIFDEIDRGVGGATADAVGRRLAALAAGSQVLVVTHSPQVAAAGAHHWRVVKSVREGATHSDVLPARGQARIDEIARMLAGDSVTEAARAAAKALLEGRD